jgi:DNA polymerase-4
MKMISEHASGRAFAILDSHESASAAVTAHDIRKIIHIDMDAFYASVEQRDNPSLRGKPVAVGGSRERGVVAAASYEARRFGVRSAMPSVTASRNCPELIFVAPRFDVYKRVSDQIRDIFAEYTPLIEPLSLDEAYLDVTANLRGFPSATATARAIQAEIFARTNLTASAGVSYNKLLAKLASDYRKPNGFYVITPERGPTFVETLAVGKFHGIGPVTAAKMNALGIFTGADLRGQSLSFLQAHFGKAGGFYYAIARGQDDREVEADRIRKSVGSENTFERDLATHDELVKGLTPLIDDVWSWCEKTNTHGRTVTLKVKYADFQLITRRRTAFDQIEMKQEFARIALDLLACLMPPPKPVRLLGVALSSLESPEPAAPRQLAFEL